MSADAAAQDAALGFQYDREYGSSRNIRIGPGSLDASQITVPEWINRVHELFPKRVIERIERNALERYKLDEMVTSPPVLQRAEPSQALLKAVLHTKHLMNAEVLVVARQMARRVAKNVDAKSTIRNNLAHYDVASKRLFIRSPQFFSRVRRQAYKWQVIVLVDESSSMADSVIHAIVTAAIFHGIRTLRRHMVLFDTSIVDVTNDVADPVETIIKVQLWGGTDIRQAMAYAAGLVETPRRTIVLLISDFFDGAAAHRLLSTTKQLCESGVTLLGLAARSAGGTELRQRHGATAGESRRARRRDDAWRTSQVGGAESELTAMPRADLLALTPEDLAALTSRGTVKRAQRDLETAELTFTIGETADGEVRVTWSDGARCVLPAGQTVADARCDCVVATLCRHVARFVLAYPNRARGDATREELAVEVGP